MGLKVFKISWGIKVERFQVSRLLWDLKRCIGISKIVLGSQKMLLDLRKCIEISKNTLRSQKCIDISKIL